MSDDTSTLDGIPLDDDEAGSLSDAALRTLLVRARDTGDTELRRLLASYVTLRRITADVIDFVATREGGQAIDRTPLLARARRLSARSAT